MGIEEGEEVRGEKITIERVMREQVPQRKRQVNGSADVPVGKERICCTQAGLPGNRAAADTAASPLYFLQAMLP